MYKHSKTQGYSIQNEIEIDGWNFDLIKQTMLPWYQTSIVNVNNVGFNIGVHYLHLLRRYKCLLVYKIIIHGRFQSHKMYPQAKSYQKSLKVCRKFQTHRKCCHFLPQKITHVNLQGLYFRPFYKYLVSLYVLWWGVCLISDFWSDQKKFFEIEGL